MDYDGTIKRVNQSVPQRDSFFSIDVEKVNEWYTAMRLYVDLLNADTVYFKLEPGNSIQFNDENKRFVANVFASSLFDYISGDILAFSNIRLLHGRTGYVDSEGDVRHLIGAYIDWDEIYSRLRDLVHRNQTE